MKKRWENLEIIFKEDDDVTKKLKDEWRWVEGQIDVISLCYVNVLQTKNIHKHNSL
jgi:ssRNA-specific RNase YbeY (16S rRNA maturation enzyme)